MNLKTKRLVIVTVIGPFDLIGELEASVDEKDIRELDRPCMIHPQNDGKIFLREMTRGGIMEGNSILINKHSVLWISEPTQALRSLYQAQRAGILVPGAAKNNAPTNIPMQ